MDKKQQAKLISEIMQDDEKDGLYEPTVSKMERVQTAVEWLFSKLPTIDKYDPYYSDIFEQAKQMEKEQIIDAILNNQNGLLRRKTIIEAQKYYNDTYNK